MLKETQATDSLVDHYIITRVRPILASGTRYRPIPPVSIRYRYRKKCFDKSTDTAHTSRLCNENNRLLFWLHSSKKEAARLHLNIALTRMHCTIIAVGCRSATATNSPILWSPGNIIRGTFALHIAATGWKSAANLFLCMGCTVRTRTQPVRKL